MKKTIIIIVFIFSLTTFISCKNRNNKIEITFIKSNVKDTIPIKYSIFKLSKNDSIIFVKDKLESIKINKKYVFDSLPDGDYILEYSNIIEETLTKKIKLKNNKIYQSKITFDTLPLEEFYNQTPISKLKNGEKYKLFTWGGCVARMESYYIISKHNNKYLFDSYNDKKRILKDAEIKDLKKFEAELLALNGKGSCNSTGRMTYTITKGNISDTLSEMTCNWNSYTLLRNKLNTFY